MEKFLQSFSFSFLLRSVFSGAFFTISYYIASYGYADFSKLDSTSILSSGLAISLIAGVAVYGLHRAIIFPFIEWFWNSETGKNARQRCPLISNSSKKWLIDRWGEDRDKHICNWADYTHLQYSSALCIGFGSITGKLLSDGNHEKSLPLIILAIIFAVAALVSDWRLHSVEDK